MISGLWGLQGQKVIKEIPENVVPQESRGLWENKDLLAREARKARREIWAVPVLKVSKARRANEGYKEKKERWVLRALQEPLRL